MGLRSQLLVIIIAALVMSVVTVVVTHVVAAERIVRLLPAGTSTTTIDGIRFLLLSQAIFLFLVTVLITIAAYLAISRMIIRPIKAMLTALEGFIARGERIALPDFSESPKELQKLSANLETFAAKVEESHMRDAEISRVKSDFISTAAHQFRTPLTGIRWALEALEKEDLTESQKVLVKSATDKSHDLVSIMGTLLDISSIESGKYKYAWEQIDLRPLVEGIARDFSQLATSRQVSIFYANDAGELPKVRADKERIKWVLNNLVENAIQYTPPGGTVRLTIEKVPGRLLIKIKDTGIGIKPEDRGNIFERFYRAPNAISMQNKGNGLGLYIARTIATDHGGDLNFAPNETGAGTTFTLSIPTLA